jgi:hypothetical protein
VAFLSSKHSPRSYRSKLSTQAARSAELAKGWSLRAIWTALSEHKELTCGYKTFIAHVRRLQQQAATTETKAITPEKRKGFTWDPTPNREELIG